MQRVKALRPGSIIGVVAPASDVNEEAFSRGVVALQQLGFQVQHSDLVFAKDCYFAGPHRQRAQDLIRMFENPAIEAIFCARGGYGCLHLLRYLRPEHIKQYPKIFMGYSDVTVLLQFLENLCGITCFHGPMVAREFALGEPYYVRESVFQCLSQGQPGQRITSAGLEALRPGIARGRLTGGCLSLLTATLGTPFEIQTEGKILFLEDVNIKPYQVDRMLMQLVLAGKLDAVQGIVFGEMQNCAQGPAQGYGLQEIVLNTLNDFNFPILYGLPSGHTTTGALTLPFGVDVLLNTEEKYIELEEAPVG